MAIKIVTDSTSYIPKPLRDTLDITVVSLNVIMDNQSTRELDLSNDTFYIEMAQSSDIPKSSQPIMEEVYDAFSRIVSNGDEVVAIFLSSEMSGTFASAHGIRDMVLENYPDAKIEILDSRSNCMQMGFVATQAATAAKQGCTMEEVLAVANQVICNSRFVFTPDTLTYLKKGGRIGSASALVGSLLQIKPILTVKDGKTDVFTKVRTKKKAVQTLVDTFFQDIDAHTLGDVIVHHINCQEEGLELAELLSARLNKRVHIQDIGPVIGLHVGPGSIGIAYFWE